MTAVAMEPGAVDFVVTGHRGAMAVEPENTMRSFQRAVDDGADELELDVHLTRDGHLAVMHDRTVDRTTNGTGAIAELTWAELQELDAGAGESIPELPALWSEFAAVSLQVEVKDPAATTAVLELARRCPRSGGLFITSFHPEAVAEAVQTSGDWQVGLIGGARDAEKLERHLTPGVTALAHWDVTETPVVQEFRSAGGRAVVWPSRTPEDVVRALDGGWAGTTADDPAMAVAARAQWQIDQGQIDQGQIDQGHIGQSNSSDRNDLRRR